MSIISQKIHTFAFQNINYRTTPHQLQVVFLNQQQRIEIFSLSQGYNTYEPNKYVWNKHFDSYIN